MKDLLNKSLLQKMSYSNGEWLDSQTTFTVTNPETGALLANVHEITDKQLTATIYAAEKAQQRWQQINSHERATILMNWFTLITKNLDDLALLLTREQGKTLADAKSEISYGCSFIQWFAEEGKRAYGDVIPALSTDKHITVIKQPVGVVAAITPWNFPNAMITRKAAAALAAGCSFIVKPAAETPLSALALAHLAEQAGLPKGLFNVVVGEDAQRIGGMLTSHASIAKFTFTGSTRTGKMLAKQCASTVKKLSLELGGNAPFIVFDDADIDIAVNALMSAKFRNCGQTCISPNRIYVHKHIESIFIEKLQEQVAALRQGNGEQHSNDIACLIHQQAANNVHNIVESSIKSGSTLLLGGLSASPTSSFYPATILKNVTHGSDITQQEIFGPVLALITFEQTEQVINQANDTDYGLAAYFFSQHINKIHQVASALKFGMIGINDTAISTTTAPFGGVKQSGYGREGSKYGLDDYLNIKYVCLGNLHNKC